MVGQDALGCLDALLLFGLSDVFAFVGGHGIS
jgi:hypothetical protein